MTDEKPNRIYLKFALDIAVIGIFILILYVVSRKMNGNAVEDQEDAHLKRLFGDAWKDAKKL